MYQMLHHLIYYLLSGQRLIVRLGGPFLCLRQRQLGKGAEWCPGTALSATLALKGIAQLGGNKNGHRARNFYYKNRKLSCFKKLKIALRAKSRLKNQRIALESFISLNFTRR